MGSQNKGCQLVRTIVPWMREKNDTQELGNGDLRKVKA